MITLMIWKRYFDLKFIQIATFLLLLSKKNHSFCLFWTSVRWLRWKLSHLSIRFEISVLIYNVYRHFLLKWRHTDYPSVRAYHRKRQIWSSFSDNNIIAHRIWTKRNSFKIYESIGIDKSFRKVAICRENTTQ